jgi:hypothetical protein
MTPGRSQQAFATARVSCDRMICKLYDEPGVNTTANVNTNGAITCCDAPITSKREQIAGIGASYVIGPAKLSLMYSNAIYNNVGTTLTSARACGIPRPSLPDAAF